MSASIMSDPFKSPMDSIAKYLGRILPYLTLVSIKRLHINSYYNCASSLDDITESNPYVDDWSSVASIRCTEFEE